MSYHIIHVLQHHSYLSVDRGCLVCNFPNQQEKRIPLSDILGVIIAARGISFSADSLSALMDNNVIVLHCNHNYKPIGKTVGLHRVIHNEILDNQIHFDINFIKQLWNKIITSKITNQAYVLDCLKVEHKLWQYLENNLLDEGNAARHYWNFYFKSFGRKNPKIRETKGATDSINGMLNYGYAVISSICHRLLLIHGLNTSIGIYHKYRFRSDPLIYDVMEPLRPVCDYMLLRFVKNNKNKKIEEWVKVAAQDIINSKINIFGLKNVNFLKATEQYISSFANSFRYKNINNLYVPLLKDIKFE